MGGAKKSTWIGATVFVALVLMAAAWFAGVSPTMSQAADLRDQTAKVTSSNEVLSAKITKLATEFKSLPDYQKQLTALRTQVPTTAQLSDYLRALDAIATAHSVVLTTITPSPAQAFVAGVGTAPKPVPTPTTTASAGAMPSPTTGTGSATGGTAAPAAAASSAVPAGFAAIPVSLTVVGTYANTLAFLSDLQTATPRLFLVAGFTGTSQQKAVAAGGRPATQIGDQELAITGFLYVLPDATAAAAPTPKPTATAALPAPVPGKDPLVPVAGQ